VHAAAAVSVPAVRAPRATFAPEKAAARHKVSALKEKHKDKATEGAADEQTATTTEPTTPATTPSDGATAPVDKTPTGGTVAPDPPADPSTGTASPPAGGGTGAGEAPPVTGGGTGTADPPSDPGSDPPPTEH
jgi:hypothetical protein